MIGKIKELIKSKGKKIFVGAILILVIAFFANFIYEIFSDDLSDLPEGEYLSSIDSPNGNYTLNAYLYDGCGATCAYTLRVEVVNNISKEKKNIYWQYRDSKAHMEWITNEIVEINGKRLNLEKNEFCNGCNLYNDYNN